MGIIKKAVSEKITDNPQKRNRYGALAGIIGMISNAVLFGFKLAAGILGGSVTIVADAVNNLSDAGTSVVTFFGFRLASRPADKEHPYGHARYEYIAGLVAALTIFAIGIALGKTSIDKMINPNDLEVSVFTYAVLITAMAVKFAQMVVYRIMAYKIDSDALKLSSIDSRNDVITTGVALVATIIFDKTGQNLDGFFGLIVSLFVVFTGIRLIKNTISPLIGSLPDKELVKKIENKLLSYPGVLGIHDLMLHNYGVSKCYAVVDIEVPGMENVMESHKLADAIEREFRDEMNIYLSVHIDPVDTSDKLTAALKKRMESTVAAIDKRITLHDFRTEKIDKTIQVSFDAALPYDLKLDKDGFIEKIKETFKSDVYEFFIEIDRC